MSWRVLLCCSGVCSVQEDIAVVVVKTKLPSIQTTRLRRLEERSQHPVSRGGLKDRVHDQST